MTPEQFIRKWSAASLSERSAAQQHFLDLCALLGEPTPADVDPEGTSYTFERGGTTATGGRGWADVWRKGVFAWEYKRAGSDLQQAYYQLKKYADALENPPLLITSDTKRIEIHTNFTNTVKKVHVVELGELVDPAKRQLLKNAFSQPEEFRPGITRQMVTTAAAERFSELAHRLQGRGYEPHRVAHFLNRIIFCMFAEDVGLLPSKIFTKLATASVAHPETWETNARQLFEGMARGGSVAFEVIEWFNGGLFDDSSTLPLDRSELELVLRCSQLDWSNIEPSIFGTLFERGLDPDKRSQQGTHYTDPDTIMKIVGPVVLEPWLREWEVEKGEIAKLVERATRTVSEAAQRRYFGFLERLYQFRVLDPACGSGNFLYLALRGLKDFEKRVILEAEAIGLPRQFPRVGPEAVLGIEVNAYAAELARVTMWIGEIQWMIENGFGASKNPILKPLDQIECRDAILGDTDEQPPWPRADVIVGNPPFLGGQFMIRGLGEDYVRRLRSLYAERLPGGIDLCCYWFEKARTQLETSTQRVGLVATQAIRAGRNRAVLDRIANTGEIFNAWSDEPWINEGAAVRVSMICFQRRGASNPKFLDSEQATGIRPDLSSDGAVNLPAALPLRENERIAFQGPVKVGAFDIDGAIAREWLNLPNPHRKPNSDVLRPWANGQDVTRRPSDTWIIDFADMAENEAALYEVPFAHVLAHVKPIRDAGRRQGRKTYWWKHGETVPALRRAVAQLPRYIATSRVSKHRFFVWLSSRVLPDSRLYVIARSDDITFGLLSSRVHETWALANASMHGVGNDPTYNAKTCFENFPFPDRLMPRSAAKPTHDAEIARLEAAARRLNELRETWLNPPELVQRIPEVAPGYPDRFVAKSTAAERSLRKRTMTNLYNEKPPWLQHAHRELDDAVAAVYRWQPDLSDSEIIRRLFELNQERSRVHSEEFV